MMLVSVYILISGGVNELLLRANALRGLSGSFGCGTLRGRLLLSSNLKGPKRAQNPKLRMSELGFRLAPIADCVAGYPTGRRPNDLPIGLSG